MSRLKNWFPALLMMALIFTFSSIPGNEMPNFERFDFSVKKLGHAMGYALLAAAYLSGLKSVKRKDHKGNEGKSTSSSRGYVTVAVEKLSVLAWMMAIAFAATDEFHQSFTPGRHPSIWDVMIYDNLGALIGLWIFTTIQPRKQKDDAHPAPPSANS